MTPEPKGEPKTVKLVCLDCGKETQIDAELLNYWPTPMIERLTGVYTRCPACDFKFNGGAVTINEE